MRRRAQPLLYASFGALALSAVALLVCRERPPPETAAARRDSAAVPVRPESAETSAAPAGERVPALAPRSPGPGRQVEVQIVRSESGEPVPGAQVWCWSRTAALGSEGDFEQWLRGGRIEEQLPRARALRADALGRVEAPEREQGFAIVAAAGELWGCASFAGPREGPARVALAPDVDLRVQVVDEQGLGVPGLPVALSERRGAA